jgi:acyl-coenzyme A thioesterase PaaI-like protein
MAKSSPPTAARLQLAAQTRRVIDELATSSAGEAAFERARDLVAAAAEVLAERDHERGYDAVAEGSLTAYQHRTHLDYSPFVGALNPLSPPLELTMFPDRVEATVTYGLAYEGPPGCLHGGFVAAGFDEVLGFAQALGGRPGMTGRLTISYRSPTPLFEPVRYIGRFDRMDGRKIFATGELRVEADGRLCAEAEGLFVSMRAEQFEELMRMRGGAAVAGEPPPAG